MMIMQIVCNYLTQSDCYKANRTIQVKGLMLHSVGCPQPKARPFMNNWNKSGANACVHAIIEPGGKIYQLLPWNHRGWHGGGVSNNTHIGVEMTEPSTIRYTGGASFVEIEDGSNTKAHVFATYKYAVELFAYLCKQYNLNPLADGVVISHSEGHVRGIASNHGDVEHIWKKHGLTMNQFRKDVKSAMGTNEKPVSSGESYYKVQVCAFRKKSNADNYLNKMKSLGFADAFIKNVTIGGAPMYRVQIGAFTVEANAKSLLAKVKVQGIGDAYITKE